MPRLEDARLLRGNGRYTDDWHLPDQTWAAFVRSPHAHARILSIQTRAAAAAPGVLAVLTGAEYLADGCVGIPHIPVPADTVDHARPAFGAFDGRKPLDQPQLPLAVGRARHPGEAVAVVIAETQSAAVDAANLVEVEYERLQAVSDVLDALAAEAPLVQSGAPGNVAVDAVFGDPAQVEQAIHAADVVVEHEFRSQRIANAQLEPRSAVGTYDAAAGSYLMIAGSQGAVRQRATLATALSVPIDRVRVICPDVGGGFGPRTSLYPEQVVVTWASRRLGRPVRWTSTRGEAFLSDFQGRDSLARARMAFGADGLIRALSVEWLFNVGAHAGSYVPLSNAARIMTSAYDVPLACVRVRGVMTNTVPTGPYRGAGRPEAMYVLERLLELAADRLGLDRVELRRRNLIEADQLPYRSAMGLTYDSGDFVQNMQRVLDQADWAGFPARRAAAAVRGRLAGISVANYVESPVGAPHERARVEVLADGQVEISVGTQSTGQGHATAFAQVVADLLGVAPACVALVAGDTDRVAAGGGTHSDRSMRLVGSLLVEACAQLRARARDMAAEFLGVPAAELEWDRGVFRAGIAGDGLGLFELAGRAPLSGEAAFTGRLPAHPTGAAVCELEVDPETGALAIVRYTCVDDVGQPINPLIVEGQVHGGIVQGLGQALAEQVVFDPATAQVLSASFLDYAVLKAAGLPRFDTALVEDPTPSNPLRIKGGGESGITPALPIVVNAVLDAVRPLGVTDLDLPLSPSRVWQAIAAARA
jgi:aerobic carbon-monoxide dehydrogenase large subunit